MKRKFKIFIIFALVTFSLLYSKEEFIKMNKVAVAKIPENIVIPDLDSITVDHKGNVFVFTGKNMGKECSVLKFDKNLDFLKQFGRYGRGPGEIDTSRSSYLPEKAAACGCVH